jgi:hypothetical protein
MMLEMLCFKDVESPIFCFFNFCFVLLFCKLLCLMLFFNGVALVSWFRLLSGIHVFKLSIFKGSVNHDS